SKGKRRSNTNPALETMALKKMMKWSGQTNPCPKNEAERSSSLDLFSGMESFFSHWIPALIFRFLSIKRKEGETQTQPVIFLLLFPSKGKRRSNTNKKERPATRA